MRIYLKNNPVKFHSDPIWNDGALGFLKRSLQEEEKEEEQQQNTNKISSDTRPLPNPKIDLVRIKVAWKRFNRQFSRNGLYGYSSYLLIKKVNRIWTIWKNGSPGAIAPFIRIMTVNASKLTVTVTYLSGYIVTLCM